MSSKQNIYTAIYLFLRVEKVAFVLLAIALFVSLCALFILEPKAEKTYADYYRDTVKGTRSLWGIVLMLCFSYALLKSIATVFVGKNNLSKLVRKVVIVALLFSCIGVVVITNIRYGSAKMHVVCEGFECKPSAQGMRFDMIVSYIISLVLLYVILEWENGVIKKAAERLVGH